MMCHHGDNISHAPEHTPHFSYTDPGKAMIGFILRCNIRREHARRRCCQCVPKGIRSGAPQRAGNKVNSWDNLATYKESTYLTQCRCPAVCCSVCWAGTYMRLSAESPPPVPLYEHVGMQSKQRNRQIAATITPRHGQGLKRRPIGGLQKRRDHDGTCLTSRTLRFFVDARATNNQLRTETWRRRLL